MDNIVTDFSKRRKWNENDHEEEVADDLNRNSFISSLRFNQSPRSSIIGTQSSISQFTEQSRGRFHPSIYDIFETDE